MTVGSTVFGMTVGSTVFDMTAGSTVFGMTAGSTVFGMTVGSTVFDMTAGSTVFGMTAGSTVFAATQIRLCGDARVSVQCTLLCISLSIPTFRAGAGNLSFRLPDTRRYYKLFTAHTVS